MTTEVRFYHLQRQSTEQALPALVNKALQTGKRIIIQTADAKAASALNDHLWTYDASSFLPHGTAKDGNAEYQPIFITHNNDNPNGAKILILTGGADRDPKTDYDLCCEIFDGNNETALSTARAKWKAYKEANSLTLTYWQQTENGWEKKA